MKVSTFLAALLGLFNLIVLVFVCSPPAPVDAGAIVVAVLIEAILMVAFACTASTDMRVAKAQDPGAEVVAWGIAAALVCVASGLMLDFELNVLRGELLRTKAVFDMLVTMSTSVIGSVALYAYAARPANLKPTVVG